MSWSASGVFQYQDAEAGINAMAPSPDSTAVEQVEQVGAAKEAAIAIVKSGFVVNDPSQDVSVSIGGHANPGHKAAPGYGNDCISVYVMQVTRQTADA